MQKPRDIKPEIAQHRYALSSWIMSNITKPIAGFEHKKNPDGTRYSYNQQLEATHHQIQTIINYFAMKGKSEQEIIAIIESFKKE